MHQDEQENWLSKLKSNARQLLSADREVARSYQELQKFQKSCEEAVLDSMSGQSLLETEIQKNTENVLLWEIRAREALAQDNEILATDALRRKYTFVQSTKEYEAKLPLMRQRRLHLHSRFATVNVIVHRLLVLRDIFDILPKQSILRDNLIALIKEFVDSLPFFAGEASEQQQSLNAAVAVAEQRIDKLEQQIAACALNYKREKPDDVERLNGLVATLRATTQKTIDKLEENLEVQRSIEAQRTTEGNEDGAWEARQSTWSDEKSLESMHRCLRMLQEILLSEDESAK